MRPQLIDGKRATVSINPKKTPKANIPDIHLAASIWVIFKPPQFVVGEAGRYSGISKF